MTQTVSLAWMTSWRQVQYRRCVWKHWPLCWCWACACSSSSASLFSLSRAETVTDAISSSWARSALSLFCLGKRTRMWKDHLNNNSSCKKMKNKCTLSANYSILCKTAQKVTFQISVLFISLGTFSLCESLFSQIETLNVSQCWCLRWLTTLLLMVGGLKTYF